MRRLLTSVLVLSLVVVGIWPLPAAANADQSDNFKATVVTSGRLNGAITVISSKRSPVAHGTVTLFTTVAPSNITALGWTHEVVIHSSSILSAQLGRSSTSPRAPPADITSLS